MADLMFKRGLYGNLHNVALTDGAVYFTTDTNELYFDDANGRHRMRDVIVVEKFEDIGVSYPTSADKAALDGRLIYTTVGNMLVTYNAAEKKWVQINSQATLTGLLKNAAFTASAGGAGVTVKQLIGENEETGVTSTFMVQTTTPNMVTFDASGNSIKINVKETEESAAISTTATTNGAKITVANTRDTLDSAGQVVSSVAGDSSNVEIVGEGNVAKVAVNANGQIAVSADFTAKIAAVDSGAVELSVTNADGTAIGTSARVAHQLKLQNAATPVSFTKSGDSLLTATLPVYSIDEVDEMHQILEDGVAEDIEALREEIATKLEAANAMTFKGTVAMSAAANATVVGLPFTGVRIGDTYKVAQEGTYSLNYAESQAESAKVGDLFIATSTNGKEDVIISDTEGKAITPANVLWTYVPSGDDAMYELYVKDGTISLGASADDVRNGTIVAGTALAIEGNGQAATVKHADVAHTATTGTAVVAKSNAATTVKAVTAVTVNDQGHVTGIETTDVTLVATAPTATQRIATTANRATVKVDEAYSDNTVTTTNFAVETDNLVIAAGTSSDAFKVNHPAVATTVTNADASASVEGLTFVTGVTVNDEGHVTAVATGGLTLEAVAPTQKTTVATATDNNAVVVMTDTYGTGSTAVAKEARLSIASDSLTVAASGSQVTIDLTWGSF